ncbi:ATP synthase subunit I [Salipaludibacillus daqingensis]|uniref:ATP synthase subunit I n=1 Tax=Salipaludibacillus daqingensis TaxID=3041001 RepID=UPI0024754CFD|nr:ATP synthase subunit I [Salipaludibacillus daqingensis]
MNDIRVLVKRYSIYTAIFIALLVIIALFSSEPAFFMGMAFGTSFSLVILLTTYFQVKRIGKSLSDRKFRFSIGTLGRMITVVVAIIVAQQFPHYLNLTGVIIGLAVTYIILLIDPILHSKAFADQE